MMTQIVAEKKKEDISSIYQLFLEPEWALNQYRMRPKAEWAIDSEAMRARGIIVLVKSN